MKNIYYNEPKFKEGWGENIQSIREYRKISISELAKEVGVSQGTVSKWEREISKPSSVAAYKLAQVLNVEVETIFDI